MKNDMPNFGITPDPWASLRRFTDARIALGRTGVSQPTQAQLAFQLAHASARDAVHATPDWQALEQDLSALDCATIRLHSQAQDRQTYLQRPDWGRRLNAASRQQLIQLQEALATDGRTDFDVAFVIADGLSAYAIQHQAVPLLQHMHPLLRQAGWHVAPMALVSQGRVAIGDEIGELLQARIVVVLIGERPGLSSPDSLGIYFTHSPQMGCHDAMRNCISNVRPAGLPHAAAAQKLMYLLTESHRRGLSGVELKDESVSANQQLAEQQSFLTR